MTTIEWTQRPGTKGESWNPIRARHRETGKVGWFCTHASEGCRNCYAEAMNRWRGNGVRYREQDRGKVDVFLDEDVLRKPRSWRKPRTVFVCSMTDLFDAGHSDEWLDRIFARMARAQDHTFQILTKRPKRMAFFMRRLHRSVTTMQQSRCQFDRDYSNLSDAFPAMADALVSKDVDWQAWPLPNVWLGTSVESRRDKPRIDDLRETPAAVRFVSFEPLLEDLGHLDLSGIHQVIAGFESGPRARRPDPDWVRPIRDLCVRADIAFFFKQWGEWAPCPISEADWVDPSTDVDPLALRRMGKRSSGALLDGREWREFPG